MKLMLTTNKTKLAKKNYPSARNPLPYAFLKATRRTMIPMGQKVPARKAFLGKSSPTMNL